jgi:hypothetical protein
MDISQDEIDRKKQNALFNLDFEEYKKQVKKERKEEVVDYEKIKYLDNYCKPTEDYTFLIVGIVMILFAIILMITYKN